MKTIIKIVVALVLLTAMFNAGRAAFNNYQFEDAVHEGLLFDPRATDAEDRRHGDEAGERDTAFRSTPKDITISSPAARTCIVDMSLHRHRGAGARASSSGTGRSRRQTSTRIC